MAATAFDSSTKSPAPTSIYKKAERSRGHISWGPVGGEERSFKIPCDLPKKWSPEERIAFGTKCLCKGHPSWAPASTEEFVKDKTDKMSSAEVNVALQISTSEVAAEAEFEELFQKFDADADDTSLRRRWNELDKLKMLSSFPEFQERFAKVKDALDARVDKRKAEKKTEKTEKEPEEPPTPAPTTAPTSASSSTDIHTDTGADSVTDLITDNGANSSSGSSTDRPKKAPKAPLPPGKHGVLAILRLGFGHSEARFWPF